MRVANARTGAVLCDRCKLANKFWSRGIGLLNRSSLEPGEGLLLKPGSSVHCFFMRFTIDVAFLDRDGKVVKLYHSMKPWRASSVVRGAKQALELPEGTLRETDTQVGDVLLLEP